MEPVYYFLIVLAVVAVLLIVAVLCRRYLKYPYKKSESLMSDAENYFYYLIKDILPSGYDIVPQASMGACFRFEGGDIAARNRVISKRFDFAVVFSDKLPDFPFKKSRLVLAIELDDRSHFQKARQKRDRFVEEVCRRTGLPLLRYKCRSNNKPDYDVKEMRQDIFSEIHRFEKSAM